MVVYKYFGTSVQPIPCRSFSGVFQNVELEEVDFGVMPIENSIEGGVNQVYDLLLTHDLKICGRLSLK